jgi:hypothetical protein
MTLKYIANNLDIFNFLLVCNNTEQWSLDIDCLFIQYNVQKFVASV